MRLFVAIELSEEMKKSVINLMHELKTKGMRGNFTPASNLHLTLCFIGETDQKHKIIEALKKIKYKPFKLSASRTGYFGDLLYLSARSGQALNALVKDIRKSLQEAEIAFDNKKFIPHITLIRKASGTLFESDVKKTEMMVKKISLMKSENIKGKTVYSEIFAF